MKITDVPFAVLRFQYQIARFPLQVIEDQVAARMDTESPARLFYERSLGMLDVTVGNALDAPEVEQRGAALIERTDALQQAALLDETATQRVKRANAELKQTRGRAAEAKKEARAEEATEIKDAQAQAQRRNRGAVEQAEKKISTGRKQADEVAAQRKKAADTVKNEEHARITDAEQHAAAAATAEFNDSEDKRIDAANKRAQADRIEGLVDTEKQKRQAEREAES